MLPRLHDVDGVEHEALHELDVVVVHVYTEREVDVQFLLRIYVVSPVWNYFGVYEWRSP